MKRYLIVIAVLTVVLFTHCEHEKPSDLGLIERSWTHSYEEEGDNTSLIYRPSNFKEFSSSRFRQYFDFKDNNVCAYLVLSPNDAHYIKEGVWEYDESNNIIKIMNGTDIVFEFKVLELDKNILKLKEL